MADDDESYSFNKVSFQLSLYMYFPDFDMF